ncbi:MAG TPA: PD-(D/E)XK nuclease family protein [Bryobacteraceae bacterium]|jgi:ATP-dependent helicase/DNAse subunit B|nr:PD-(D/E)XK nuclease family protein [Bryobacteraceae bacterium]
MRLIRGAPGAGKTALAFREFKEALRAGNTELRIIVPTATLVRHFRHELARDGVVYSPRQIVSLNRFASERAPGLESVPDVLLAAIVRESLKRVRLPEFADVADTEGMAATVAETIALFENAGCTPDKLAAIRRLPPHARAFERVWRAVEEHRAATGYRSRLEIFRAAAAVKQPGQIWMDGFLSLSPLESLLVSSLAESCDLTLTLDDSPATDDVRLLAMQLGAKDVPLPPKARKPRTTVVEARTPEREADEIARRIIELHGTGTPFRQIGVAFRDTAACLPRLRAAFDRFGIPARFYFSSPLRSHPVAVFLGGLISCALTDWDFEATIETLRAHPKWGRTADFDRFDFAVREAMPGHGGDALLALCESEWLKPEIAACLKTTSWKSDRQTPAKWSARLERLAAALYRPGALDGPRDHSAIAIERTHTAALDAWLSTLQSIVAFWPDAAGAISLDEFWRVAGAAIESAVLRADDDRADVVHVMEVHEARQWDLQALFVCGMADRNFPRRHAQNLLFPDGEIDRLRAAGIPLRNAADFERQENWLFESLRTRASKDLILSYAAHDASGKSVQPSSFLDGINDGIESSVRATPCLPAAARDPQYPGVAGQIHGDDLLAGLARIHQTISLTALEDLAQCRFKFFGGRSLALKTSPERPGERLQPRLTGSILHQALERWIADRSQNFIEIFEKTFDEVCFKEHIPAGYRLEVERIQFREIAEKISANERWTPDSSLVEVDLTLDFPGGVTVRCRIDRIDKFDRFGNDCVIVDYKSSKTARVEQLVQSTTRLQGPLYALAVREKLQLNPVAMLYWAVREDQLHGWGRVPGTEHAWQEIPENWEIDARARTIDRLTEFLNGAVQAKFEEKEQCRWCDYAHACRVEQPALVVITAAAEGAA